MNHHLRLVGTPALCHHCRAPFARAGALYCEGCAEFLYWWAIRTEESIPGSEPWDLRYAEIP